MKTSFIYTNTDESTDSRKLLSPFLASNAFLPIVTTFFFGACPIFIRQLAEDQVTANFDVSHLMNAPNHETTLPPSSKRPIFGKTAQTDVPLLSYRPSLPIKNNTFFKQPNFPNAQYEHSNPQMYPANFYFLANSPCFYATASLPDSLSCILINSYEFKRPNALKFVASVLFIQCTKSFSLLKTIAVKVVFQKQLGNIERHYKKLQQGGNDNQQAMKTYMNAFISNNGNLVRQRFSHYNLQITIRYGKDY